MQAQLVADLKTDEEKRRFKELWDGSRVVLDKLKKICYNRYKEKDELKSSLTDYDNPNWAYRQADLNGYFRAYKEIIKFLEE